MYIFDNQSINDLLQIGMTRYEREPQNLFEAFNYYYSYYNDRGSA